MKLIFPTIRRAAILGTLVFLNAANIVKAESTISWSTPTTISADSDVQTTGTFISAGYFTNSGSASAVSVNGVTFTPYSTTILNANSTFTTTGSTSGSSSAPFSGLSGSYQTILSSGLESSAGSSATLTLPGLTAGHTYLVEFWVNNSAGGVPSSFNETVSDGDANDATGPITYNTAGSAGGLGQFVTGTFIADSTLSESFTFTPAGGYAALLNASAVFDISSVPEPASIAMLGISGLVGLGAFARRRWSKTARSN